jgi:hypothetical protein
MENKYTIEVVVVVDVEADSVEQAVMAVTEVVTHGRAEGGTASGAKYKMPVVTGLRVRTTEAEK